MPGKIGNTKEEQRNEAPKRKDGQDAKKILLKTRQNFSLRPSNSTGADPGYSQGWFGELFEGMLCREILKMISSILGCNLGGSTEPPLDPP